MKTLLILFVLFSVTWCAPSAHAQDATARTRGESSTLPPTCAPGGMNRPPDSMVLGGVPYVCTAANKWTRMQGLDADNSWTGNNRFCGPIPWADVSCFGAHAPAGGVPSTTANCIKGSNQIVVAAPHTFEVNDGVTIYGCGATNTMTAPTGLKVVPSEPWGLAETRSALAGPAGGSTYEYTVVARDIYGALTAPATPVELKTGQTALGLQRIPLKTLSRKNDRITVVTAEPNKLVVGALVDLEPKDSQQFAGWYNIAKIDSGTQFELWTTPTDTRAQGWMVGDTVTYSGGGSVAFYQENFLQWSLVKGAWEYYVCGKRPGEQRLKLIGVTQPTGLQNGYTDVAFEDYGSPYLDG
jgi:hypothetical protein